MPGTRFCPLAANQHAHVLFRRGDFQRFFGCGWRDDHFDKLTGDDGLRGFRIQLAVEGDNAAERGGRVGFVGAIVGIHNGGAYCDAAWVGVLDDNAGRLAELFHAFQRGVGIGNVVIRGALPCTC